jgi:GNAT superfamily N-acetyltransferase
MLRQVTTSDIPVLVDLMEQFYAESGYSLDHALAAEAFASVIGNERLGGVWFINDEDRPAGYLVLTYRFAMEYSGMIACLDDLFVQPEYRNKGFATMALFEIRSICQAAQMCAITVEVGTQNAAACGVYHRVGFLPAKGRELMALHLPR